MNIREEKREERCYKRCYKISTIGENRSKVRVEKMPLDLAIKEDTSKVKRTETS